MAPDKDWPIEKKSKKRTRTKLINPPKKSQKGRWQKNQEKGMSGEKAKKEIAKAGK
jgi:hypothetical protein